MSTTTEDVNHEVKVNYKDQKVGCLQVVFSQIYKVYSLLCPSRKILLMFKSSRIDLKESVLLYFDIRQFHWLQPIWSGCSFPFVETISAQICVIQASTHFHFYAAADEAGNAFKNGKLLNATRKQETD